MDEGLDATEEASDVVFRARVFGRVFGRVFPERAGDGRGVGMGGEVGTGVSW